MKIEIFFISLFWLSRMDFSFLYFRNILFNAKRPEFTKFRPFVFNDLIVSQYQFINHNLYF